MPITPTYPGVYVEEIPSGVRTITGVATSVAAFIDYFKRGPIHQPVQILSLSDFAREFGGLDSKSEASYGIQQFFLNGGAQAWVIRSAHDGALDNPVGTALSAAALDITDGVAAALKVRAVSQGAWGNSLRVRVERTLTPGEFNLAVAEYATVGNRTSIVRQEVFRNLTVAAGKPNSAPSVINDANTGSKLVRVDVPNGTTTAPLGNGTLSDVSPALPVAGSTVQVKVSASDSPAPVVANAKMVMPASNVSLAAVAALLQAGIRAAVPDNPLFAGATVDVVSLADGQHLRVLAGPGNPTAQLTFDNVSAGDTTADTLKLKGQAGNVQEYLLGTGIGLLASLAGIASTGQGAGTEGQDGLLPGRDDLVAAIGTLEQVDLFNLLCIPRAALLQGKADAALSPLSVTAAQAVVSVAKATCESRRALFLMDTPAGYTDYQAMRAWLADNDTARSPNAALYYPRVQVPDPLNGSRLRSIGASGTIAGLYARVDAARGLWKAPAGTEASLQGVFALDDVLTDAQNGILNPLAINCLRSFPVYGNVAWGARTLAGSDAQASDWKYVPVRRLAMFIEESLFRGTKWVVFEPNDEPLWAQVRLNVGAFMHNLFRQGAFQGKTPKEAYLVKCDPETTTQADINQGVVNIMVGFAPLKPAEFVFIKLQQLAGQIAT